MTKSRFNVTVSHLRKMFLIKSMRNNILAAAAAVQYIKISQLFTYFELTPDRDLLVLISHKS